MRCILVVLPLCSIVHNIAEGFAVAVPVWAGTGSRWLALGLTALSVSAGCRNRQSSGWIVSVRLGHGVHLYTVVSALPSLAFCRVSLSHSAHCWAG